MRGIVYIGLGGKYLSMSIDSAISMEAVTAKCPPIIIFTDSGTEEQISNNIFIHRIDDNYRIDFSQISNDFNPAFEGAYLKTRLFDLSPFEKTLYLDSDILAIKDINTIWKYASKNIGLAPAFCPLQSNRSSPEAIDTFDKLTRIGNYDQYNAGVVLFGKNQSIRSLFAQWTYEWGKFKESDNMALTRALCCRKQLVERLPSKYNEFYPWKNINSVLIHYVCSFKIYL